MLQGEKASQPSIAQKKMGRSHCAGVPLRPVVAAIRLISPLLEALRFQQGAELTTFYGSG